MQAPAFTFPAVTSTVLPDPSTFFSPNLLADPLPTNSFFQNFALKNGDQPEYIHPYLIKSANSALAVSFPSLIFTAAVVYQTFAADLSISTAGDPRHVISSFSDLSVTLDFPKSNLRFFLVRGSPYLTCAVTKNSPVVISTIHAILSVSPNEIGTKHTVKLNNNQTWLVYSSAPIKFENDVKTMTSGGFSGIIRVAVVPESDPRQESILDKFSPAYPVSGEAKFGDPFGLQYVFEKEGSGDLLMLAHPLHVRLFPGDGANKVTIFNELKYQSIDGELVGVVSDSWVLKSDPIPVTWRSIKGPNIESYPEIVSALEKDIAALKTTPIPTPSSYFYGKLVARAARLALIAEETNPVDLIPTVAEFLKSSIQPWLDGTLSANGFLYESKWGGLVTKQGSVDAGADFGFGVYNDHHFHIGYFLYGIAVLAKFDQVWAGKYKAQAYSLMNDVMTPERGPGSVYPRLRCFDLYTLHSWAGGVTEFGDGRNQESTSEAVNAYYSAALVGLAYEDTKLVSLASTLVALEVLAAQTWWHVRESDTIYGADFTRENRILGILWSNKRDTGLWFAAPEMKEIRLGIHVLPILPITETLFADAAYTRSLVEWALPALAREGVAEGWKGFVYALQGVYDKIGALEKIKALTGHDDGSSLSNMLWWVHSRANVVGGKCVGRSCFFGRYYD